MAAPVFRAVSTEVAAITSGTLTLTMPTGYQVNDILIAQLEHANQAPTSTPTGWTQFTSSPQVSGTAGAVGGNGLSLYWKRATSTSETAPAFNFTGDHLQGQVVAYSGATTSGDPTNVQLGGTSASATTFVVSSITTTVNDCAVILFFNDQVDSASARFSGYTNSTMTITERSDVGTASGNGGGMGIADGALATAGATGTTTITHSAAPAVWIAIALAPAAAASPSNTSAFFRMF